MEPNVVNFQPQYSLVIKAVKISFIVLVGTIEYLGVKKLRKQQIREKIGKKHKNRRYYMAINNYLYVNNFTILHRISIKKTAFIKSVKLPIIFSYNTLTRILDLLVLLTSY